MASDGSREKVVLVTGINGFIASRIGMDLLEKGYHLRGTVRNVSSAKRLLDGAYKAYAFKIEIVQVKDFTMEGCFEKAVKGWEPRSTQPLLRSTCRRPCCDSYGFTHESFPAQPGGLSASSTRRLSEPLTCCYQMGWPPIISCRFHFLHRYHVRSS